jgi:hypothetical protein
MFKTEFTGDGIIAYSSVSGGGGGVNPSICGTASLPFRLVIRVSFYDIATLRLFSI